MSLFRRFLRGFLTGGTLTVIEPGGRAHSYGAGEPRVAIRVHDRNWPRRVVWRPDLAVGEGYTEGAFTLEEGDLETFLQLCIGNRQWGRGHWVRSAIGLLERAGKHLQQLNPVSRSRGNAAYHYDLPVDFFDLFLDSQRQYSCAYFASPHDDLETAQKQKLRHIAAKLLLQPGMSVLDVGCGWGGLALYLARHCGVRVTGITLASEQLQVAREQARLQGLDRQVDFRLLDYRQVHEQYDRVVSVGMFEHVGTNHYGRYVRQLRRCLKPDGIALLHAIGRADGPGVTNAWTRKYIFPGGYSPALSEVLPVIERERLFLTDLEVLRLHYAETTRRWLQRFRAHREQACQLYGERFCRMWEFYLAAAEASFRWGALIVFQAQLARDIQAVPLTRNYIGAAEEALATSSPGPGPAAVRPDRAGQVPAWNRQTRHLH